MWRGCVVGLCGGVVAVGKNSPKFWRVAKQTPDCGDTQTRLFRSLCKRYQYPRIFYTALSRPAHIPLLPNKTISRQFTPEAHTGNHREVRAIGQNEQLYAKCALWRTVRAVAQAKNELLCVKRVLWCAKRALWCEAHFVSRFTRQRHYEQRIRYCARSALIIGPNREFLQESFW